MHIQHIVSPQSFVCMVVPSYTVIQYQNVPQAIIIILQIKLISHSTGWEC